MGRPATNAAYFWTRVDKSDANGSGCWLWKGRPTSTGCGQIQIAGKNWKAYRAAWLYTFGEIPARDDPRGHCICHKCDNRMCVRPDHLFVGTIQDNVTDCIAKGRKAPIPKNRRLPKGSAHHATNLTESDVLFIRKTCAETPRSVRKMARLFGVHRSAVTAILCRRTWRHI